MVIGPYRGLYFPDMGFLEKKHAETALAYSTADGGWKLTIEKHAVEVEILAVFGVACLELVSHAFCADPNAH